MDQETTSATTTSQSNQPDFVRMEHQILKFWKEGRHFRKLQTKLAGRPLFRFLDGPITANNPMGVHHAWGRTLKDIFIRFKTLEGYDCHFQNGFDCQGLWVEVEVEKELGFKGKPDIEAFGLDKFSQACKERVRKFSAMQAEQSIRLGQWMDWENSYYTHTDKNIEGIWGFLKKCHENGWLYRSSLPMPWCTRCGTSLSEHEMAGSYVNMKHLAVYIKLKVPSLKSRILVWTTTPWTLAANTALAVNPELEYAQVQLEGEDLPLIISTDVLNHWESGSSLKGKAHRVLKTMKGTELLDLEYEPVIPDLPVQQGFVHRIVPWKLVDPSEGTGVVHIAPGCGREDFELSQEIPLERLAPVDERGDYLPGYGFLEGKNVKAVADEVASYLEANGRLFGKYMHEHSYPVCWRCKDDLIFRLVDEWYISTKQIKPQMIEASRSVEWQPDHLGKRMEDWLNNMGDWCISRKRFWGLPLPFYLCTNCGCNTIVGSRAELQTLTDYDVGKLSELHRPWIDEITIKCPGCKRPVSRVSEVGDCWLDAGIVPISTAACYSKQDQTWAPADWICEMSEQIRLWFYSMLFMGVTLKQQAPYNRVLTHERVSAEDGSRFSKTGYMIRFDDAAEQMGVDTMRYYFASQPPTSELRFGYTLGNETRRQLISIWNIFAFFNTYASIDKPSFGELQDVESKIGSSDRWLLASTFDFVRIARQAYAEFNTPAVISALESFVEGVSNWYIRSNRRRFWKSENTEDKLLGYWALFQALRGLSIATAPIIPFLSETIWQEAIRRFEPDSAESVHLSDWPMLPDSWADEQMVRRVEQVRQVVNLGHRLRAESGVKVRQPLATLYLALPDSQRLACQEMSSVLLSELNVKQIQYLSDKSEIFCNFIELDLKKAGPVLKGDVSKVVAIVNALSEAQASSIAECVKAQGSVQLEGYAAALPAEIFVVKSRTRPNHIAAEERGMFVALDTTITKELEEEGWVREILRQSQVLRKDSGLDVQDRIALSLRTDSGELRQVIERERAFIEKETLGTLSLEPLPGAIGQTKLSVAACDVTISIAKRE